MPAIDRSLDAVAFVTDHFRDIVRRRLSELLGLALITLALLAIIALSTWSVQDPSLSHATNAPVHNLLGKIGAITSDLLMQLFGLAAVAWLAPLFLTGWRLLAHRPTGSKWRHIAWLPATLFAAAFASCMPLSASWPLPTGLGGVVGDALLRVPAFIAGAHLASFELAATAMLCGIVILGSVFIAADWHWPQKGAPQRIEPTFDDNDIETDDDHGSNWLGLLAHTLLSAKAQVARWLRPSQRPLARAAMPAPRTPRSEPRLEAGGMRGAPPLIEDDEFDDTVEAEETPTPRKRVATRAAVRRSGGYELPSLDLLAKTKIVGQPLSSETIQANAVALESVLGDFGVRGEIINARPGPVVTLYELEPAPGIKSSRVIGLADDIARSMSAVSARVAVVSGRNAIGIELPNPTREQV
ncbi:MAG: DNA translocase FtsK 4TM domain-containing protein, partial [Pseudolabrys sp.]|nr:DNA translocase FtsK 4TM domain-containing protein [Pseudolabrys sp.]